MRRVRIFRETWPLRKAGLAPGEDEREVDLVVMEIEEDGILACGEAAPNRRFGEICASVMAQIGVILPDIEKGLARERLQQILPPGAARAVIDCALWDLAARKKNMTLVEYLECERGEYPLAKTLLPDTPSIMAEQAARYWQAGRRALCVQLDERLISERMVAIREAVPDATLLVDARESWRAEGLAACCQLLADLHVALLIQPLGAFDDAALECFVHPLPICADASCHSRGSLKALEGRYEAIDISLGKCGGLTEALALAYAARERELRIKVSTGPCTSRCAAASLPLAPWADYLDIDGPGWLEVDVEPPLLFPSGLVRV